MTTATKTDTTRAQEDRDAHIRVHSAALQAAWFVAQHHALFPTPRITMAFVDELVSSLLARGLVFK